MTYEEFLTHVIDEGISAAKADYTRLEDKARLDGSVEGFEACRGKHPIDLQKLFWDARQKSQTAYHEVNDKQITDEEYWRINSFEAEIGWTCNVVSAMLMNEKMAPLDPLMPTARAVMKCAEILKKEAA
jgi:hypothetical protein